MITKFALLTGLILTNTAFATDTAAIHNHLTIAVRYGARILELARGKFAVEVPSPAQLIPTLELIKNAIDAGELDEQLEATAGSVKAAFKRGAGS